MVVIVMDNKQKVATGDAVASSRLISLRNVYFCILFLGKSYSFIVIDLIFRELRVQFRLISVFEWENTNIV